MSHPGDDPFGPELSTNDLRLIERALRAHWPISPATQRRLLRKVAAEALHKDCTGRKLDRHLAVILAAQRNQLAQGKLDLMREIFEARNQPNQEFNLAQLVADAEQRALEYRPAARPEGN